MPEKNQLNQSHHPRPQWRSQLGFILAALGSAVGLGNIWRFSYLCYKHGGGTFLVPYVIALFAVGIPLMVLELGLGHRMRGSSPMSFAKANRSWEWCGWWAVVCAMFGIMLYYSAVIAWCMNYVSFSTNLAWGEDANAFFMNKFLQITSGPWEIGNIRTPILFAIVLVWVFSWLIVYFGIQKGVERANKIFMPILLILTLILVVWSVNLEGAHLGLKAYLTPKFHLLKKTEIWIDAFSQIFFTLSLAFGIMTTYASYLPRKVNIVKDAFVISIGNCLFSIIAGFAVFGTLGYMSHMSGKPVEEVVGSSIGLAFITYPQAISLLPAFSNVFGIIFFSALVIAGLSSAISLIEAFSSAMIDKFHYSRKPVVSVICLIGAIASIIFTARSGIFWVDIIDHFVTNYGLVTIGIIECILIAWFFNAGKLQKHINTVSGKSSCNAVWVFCVKFVAPGTLILLLFDAFTKEIAKPYEGYPWSSIVLIGCGWLILTLLASLFMTSRPWKKGLVDSDIFEE